MISAWHLLWIIPLSSTLGIFIMALLTANSRGGKENEK